MNLFKIAGTFIATVFILIIVGWLLIGVVFVKGCQWIQKDGLKGVSEQVWNGTGAASNAPPAPEGVK